MRKSTLKSAIWILAAAWIGVAGCGKPASDTGSTDSGASAGKPTATGKKFKIVYIPKNTGNPYFDDIINGFKKASDELGYEFTTVAPAKADSTSQLPFIKQQVQQKVDAIAISANSPDALKPALLEAMQRGIKVIAVNSDLPKNEDARNAAVLPADFNTIGSSQIALMSELMGGKGDFAILSATTDAPDQNFWIEGMKEALKDPKYKDLKLVEIAYGDDEPQKSLTEAQSLLIKYPNLKGILAPTSVGLASAAQAVETANAIGRVQVTGLSTPNQMRRFVQNGTVQKFALWSPFDEGYLCGYLLDGMLKGSIKPTAGGLFRAGKLGDKKFGDKNSIITGPSVVFDKSNIEQYHF